MSQVEASASTTAQHVHRIARAAGLVMALFIVSRVLGLLREMVIARQFGTSPEMDAYVAAFRLPDLLFYLVAGGALGSAFIPVFAGHLSRADWPAAWQLASAVINWVALVLAGLAGLSAVLTPGLVPLFFPDFTAAQQNLTVELIRLLLCSTVIFGVSGVVMAILNAQQQFFLPALAPIFYNLAIILGAWLLGPLISVRGLAIGAVVGAAGHLLVQLPGLRRGLTPLHYQLTLAPQNRDLHEVGRLMGPRVVGVAAVQINFIVTAVLAAGLPAGSLAALNYSWIIMLLPQGIIAQSVATALFPTLAALAAKGDIPEMRRIFGATLRSMLFLTLPATAGLILLGEPIIRLILQGGRFSPDSTRLTTWALSFFALGLVGHALVEIAVRAFYALKDTKTPVGIGLLAMGVNIGLSFGLMPLFLGWGWPGHAGLALANSLAVIFEMIILLVVLQRRMGGLSETALRAPVTKVSLATAGMALALLVSARFWPENPSWLAGLAGISLGGAVYVGLAYALGVDELKSMERRILRNLSRLRRQ